MQSFLPLADYSKVFRKCPWAGVDTMPCRRGRTACRRTATGSSSGGAPKRDGGRLLGEWRSSSEPPDARPADRRGRDRV